MSKLNKIRLPRIKFKDTESNFDKFKYEIKKEVYRVQWLYMDYNRERLTESINEIRKKIFGD